MDERPDIGGEPPRGIAQITLTLLSNGGLHINVNGLPPDIVERALYGAMKHLDRQMLIAQLPPQTPRVLPADGDMLPRLSRLS